MKTKIEIKPMIYSAEHAVSTLASGEIDGFCFKIKSMGTHPTAYIKIPNSHPYYGKDYDDCEINTHGGLTYGIQEEDGYWIGWDYAHYMDYMGYEELYPLNLRTIGGKRWTTDEILKDVLDVISQLKTLHKD